MWNRPVGSGEEEWWTLGEIAPHSDRTWVFSFVVEFQRLRSSTYTRLPRPSASSSRTPHLEVRLFLYDASRTFPLWAVEQEDLTFLPLLDVFWALIFLSWLCWRPDSVWIAHISSHSSREGARHLPFHAAFSLVCNTQHPFVVRLLLHYIS